MRAASPTRRTWRDCVTTRSSEVSSNKGMVGTSISCRDWCCESSPRIGRVVLPESSMGCWRSSFQRPTIRYSDQSDRNLARSGPSFPSGHTSVAFAFAEFLAQEYGDKSPIYTIIGYSFATTTGVFRIYNKAHWFSDVVAGAGFGILSTKAAYLVYPYIRNALTHTDKAGKNTFIMPTYQDGVAGLSFAKQF